MAGLVAERFNFLEKPEDFIAFFSERVINIVLVVSVYLLNLLLNQSAVLELLEFFGAGGFIGAALAEIREPARIPFQGFEYAKYEHIDKPIVIVVFHDISY